MNRIRVLIVEDSAVVAEHLRRIIGADGRFQVAGTASTGEEALAMLDALKPDVISMDIHLPGMQGFETTRRIMSKRPTPIVIVSGSFRDEVSVTMKALQAGALAVVEKPRAATHENYAAIAGRLCNQLAIMSEVKVVRQREREIEALAVQAPAAERTDGATSYRVLGVAASTGGPGALMTLLRGLGGNFALPVVIVQHMTASFLGGFAEWLSGVAPFPIKLVERPMAMQPGHAYLASGSDYHLAVRGITAYPDAGAPDGVHRPAANVLFSSMARTLGNSGIGVILTGMGEDGAHGLSELKRAGGWTLAEDESTATVYGMPAAAMRLGAVDDCLPLRQIAARIRNVVTGSEEKQCQE